MNFLFKISLLVGCLLPVAANPAQSQQLLPVRIAIGQVFCLDGDREGNFVRIEHAVRDAAELGADMITFPETALLGWVNPEAHHKAHPVPGPDSDRLCRMAMLHDIWISIGMAEKEGDQLYDSAILIDNIGNIVYKHRKINILSELMEPPYTPGDLVGTVETPWGRIGMIICADSWGEGILDRMKAEEPDLMLIPYGWAAPENDWPEHGRELEAWVTHIARTLNCPVVGTDLVGEITHGPWKGLVYGGQSVAADRSGNVIVRCADRDRDVRLVTFQLQSRNEWP